MTLEEKYEKLRKERLELVKINDRLADKLKDCRSKYSDLRDEYQAIDAELILVKEYCGIKTFRIDVKRNKLPPQLPIIQPAVSASHAIFLFKVCIKLGCIKQGKNYNENDYMIINIEKID